MEISGCHLAAHIIVRADRVDTLGGCYRRKDGTDQHRGDRGLVALQQGKRAVAGTGQQNAVYSLTEEKVKKLVDAV